MSFLSVTVFIYLQNWKASLGFFFLVPLHLLLHEFLFLTRTWFRNSEIPFLGENIKSSLSELQELHQLMMSLFNSLLQLHLAPSTLPGRFFTASECSCLKHYVHTIPRSSSTLFFLFSFFLKFPYFRSLLLVPAISTYTYSPGQRHDCDKMLERSNCRDS